MGDKFSALRSTLTRDGIDVIYHEQTVGFLAQEESIEHRRVKINPDGQDALCFIEQLLGYVSHDIGCAANDLDYLDKTPCTCGLRNLYNPKGITNG